ncbi:CACTA en-spm transposon protein [Cucumis melo var. makuwa]|uniref:CACTA en-spm transposon protein n=1 Tax=Cucumis melo var. makuwa TaxID=1194695 RepID=A0A5D3E534_CUCMM|nr:CACTA en-spm transposon protein [Cucumis melo var. makuwa]
MGPSFDICCYNGCIVGDLRFHTSELDSRRTTQNNIVMVIGESDASGSGDNNFYCVPEEVLHVQYPLERNIWLFKYRWYDTDLNKSERTHVELGYKSVNTSHFLYAEESVIFVTQAHQGFYVDNFKNGSYWKVVEVVQNKRVWDVPEVEDVENDHINVLEIVISHRVDDHIEDDTLCKTNVDPTIIERSVVRHVTDNFINDVDEHLLHASIMSYGRNNFLETDAICSSKLEHDVAVNGCILMTIAPGVEKPISPHVVHFSQAIGRFFVLDFNDQAMNRFVEHQMLTTFKKFQGDCNKHFKKYSDSEEARANPPNVLVGRHEDWHFFCDHYMSRAFQEQSRTNKAARQKHPYNHSSRSKSFLQRQHELVEKKGDSVYRVELFWETHSQPTAEGSQPLSENEICDQVLGRRPAYSKGLGWGPKSKAHKTMSASSSTTSCSQSATEREIQIQAKLDQALEQIDCKIKITRC